MPEPKCPRCGAKVEDAGAHLPERCSWCGALLGGERGGGALFARPRVNAPQARVAVARALSRSGRTWLPGVPQLVFYPFIQTGAPRNPLAPLAQLPPVLRGEWRPSGADLLSWSGAATAGVTLEGAVRVPAPASLAAEVCVVQYPLFRVPLRQEGRDSAAWCDATSGQVILPDDLGAPAGAGAGRDLPRFALTVLALGAAAGLLAPFPYSLAPLAALGVWLWRRVARR